MAKTSRLELRVEPGLKERLVAECDRRGMKVATFVERAVESALSVAPEPYALEAERRAVREAVEAGTTAVRVEAGSILPSRYGPKRDVRPVPKEKP